MDEKREVRPKPKAIDPSATDDGSEIELSGPSVRELHFLGEPILALNAATNNLSVPAHVLRHPLVENRYFFTLPGSLLDDVLGAIGEKAVDPDLVTLERSLSEICGDHSTSVGFWNGQAFPYCLLRTGPMKRPSAEESNTLGWNMHAAQLDNAMRLIEERTEPFTKVSRAYAGWLLTNLEFLNEHDALLTRYSDMVKRWGLGRLGILLPKGTSLPGDDPAADPRWKEHTLAFEAFFVRWRLQGLAAPYLPVPLQPLMGGDFPASVLPQVARAGGVFCLPDTFPIPSRDELRNLLEASIHGSQRPGHLEVWMSLIAADNAARKSLPKYARLFELQHYWRIVHHRYKAFLRGKIDVLKGVVGRFLGIKQSTIREHLRFINKQLGNDWCSRGTFPFGPF